ncbi:MAG: FtsW/RodA/SpoVE family cell cycle protein [Bacilli bacterium]|nr:FtsW/RodA/SpoVE family cell cycle protein [Bacilli bacterium]
MKKSSKPKILRNINYPLLIFTVAFAIVGAFLILDASSISSVLYYKTDSPSFFFEKQLQWILLGGVLSLVILNINTKLYKVLAPFAAIACAGMLFYVYTTQKLFSSNVTDVTLSLFGGRFQPAEFLKIFIIMYLGCFFGSWVNKPDKKTSSMFIPLLISGGSALLVLLGGDFGTACIMLAIIALTLACIPLNKKPIKKIKVVGIPITFTSVPDNEKWLKRLKILGLVGLFCGVIVLKFGYKVIDDEILKSDYRLQRLIYTNPCDRYEEVTGSQVCNGYIAMDNGGLQGQGIGNSTQKYLYLFASHTDFIFPIVIEEFGVISGILIIFAYMVVIYIILKVAVDANNLQNSIIAYGIGIYFMVHIFINLGGVLGVIPLTGVPLPFLSYGGSFCVSVMCAFAVVQRIHIETKISKKQKELNKNN